MANIKMKKKKFTFIDLFAGIGGFHIAFNNVGAKCVFSSEWDSHARNTYQTNFEKIDPELFSSGNFVGDITKIDPKKIPNFDILTGGFPCQPFSQAGFKKGFNDTRGTLFYNIAEIIRVKKPKAFFLENVRGLLAHDNGKTFEVISNVLTKDLGYSLHFNIVKASEHGLPQNRPRLFMIGFKNKKIPFEFPQKRPLKFTMSDVFDGAKVNKEVGFTLRVGGKGSNITDRRNWDSYLVNGKVKRITSKEGKKMQGFPEDFIFPVTESQAMKQLGNSVAIYAIQDYAKKIIEALENHYD
ncbi:MAG: DNA cytosine methyltransferase [Candidatus Paceibacterota bacterium]|jgi:DNA (cytosine-5)-methyltransferase 1